MVEIPASETLLDRKPRKVLPKSRTPMLQARIRRRTTGPEVIRKGPVSQHQVHSRGQGTAVRMARRNLARMARRPSPPRLVHGRRMANRPTGPTLQAERIRRHRPRTANGRPVESQRTQTIPTRRMAKVREKETLRIRLPPVPRDPAEKDRTAPAIRPGTLRRLGIRKAIERGTARMAPPTPRAIPVPETSQAILAMPIRRRRKPIRQIWITARKLWTWSWSRCRISSRIPIRNCLRKCNGPQGICDGFCLAGKP